MTGKQRQQGRSWSTRQRLVVLTFDTAQQAHQFDLAEGLPPVDALIEGFDVENVDGDAWVALMGACRDVIDVWDDGEEAEGTHDLDRLSAVVERMRRTLFNARQGAIR